MKFIYTILLAIIVLPTFCQEDVNDPSFGDNVVEGAIVNAEYRFDLGYILLKNNKSKYYVQSNKTSQHVAINGVNIPIGQHQYNEIIVDPNTDSFIYLDSKSMTGVTSVISVEKSDDPVEMKLIPTDKILICNKECIVLNFQNKKFKYQIWLTIEEDQSIVDAALKDLNVLMNIEQLGELGSLKITNQVWMKFVVENLKTKKKNTYEVTDYYKSIDESSMTFDYEFITPKWD